MKYRFKIFAERDDRMLEYKINNWLLSTKDGEDPTFRKVISQTLQHLNGMYVLTVLYELL